MSQFYDNASLVVIPSGYKAGTVYAQKPLTTDGQLAFTRTGDTATRVNSAGLIEKVRTNLFLQSEAFNVTWSKSAGITLTSGQTDPFGGTDAFLVSFGTTLGNSISQSLSVVSGVKYTMSAYIKGVDLTGLRMIVAGNSSASVMSQVVNGTWVRVVITGTAATTGSLTNQIARSDNTLDQSFYIYGAQIETGEIATAYIPTTTAAVSVGPTANVPRLDYLGSTCPRLLLEPQRTNLYTFSEQLNQWTASSATVTANYAVSPDGYTNADRVQFAAGGLLYIGGTGSAGENTLSVYAKATNGTSAKFRFFGNGNTTNSSDQTATGEWQRFTFTYTYSVATAGLKIATTGADDILFYGFQHEIGAYPTSLIPTLAASATRGADACSKTGISSLIGQTEGTLFADIELNLAGSNVGFYALQVYDSASSPTYTKAAYIEIYQGKVYGYVRNTTIQGEIISSTYADGTRLKIGFGYKANDFVLYVNGIQIGVDTSGSLPSVLNALSLHYSASTQQASPLSQALLFKTRLTNAELAELTTL
jgi:hypothetical protein